MEPLPCGEAHRHQRGRIQAQRQRGDELGPHGPAAVRASATASARSAACPSPTAAPAGRRDPRLAGGGERLPRDEERGSGRAEGEAARVQDERLASALQIEGDEAHRHRDEEEPGPASHSGSRSRAARWATIAASAAQATVMVAPASRKAADAQRRPRATPRSSEPPRRARARSAPSEEEHRGAAGRRGALRSRPSARRVARSATAVSPRAAPAATRRWSGFGSRRCRTSVSARAPR